MDERSFLTDLETVKQVEFQLDSLSLGSPKPNNQETAVKANKKSPRRRSRSNDDDDNDDYSDGADSLLNKSHKYSKRHKKKMRSKKHGRRHENFCYMLNIVYGESITDDEFEFDEEVDLVDNRDTPFTKLILDQEKLKVWVEFVSKSGQQQEDYLEELDMIEMKMAREKRKKQSRLNSSGSSDSDHENERKLRVAQRSFFKIDRNIREAMRKDASIGCVQKLENEVIVALEVKEEHCLNNMACSFERLILHGLCQYLNIKSKSVDDGAVVSVTIKCHKVFKKPAILLSDLLLMRKSLLL